MGLRFKPVLIQTVDYEAIYWPSLFGNLDDDILTAIRIIKHPDTPQNVREETVEEIYKQIEDYFRRLDTLNPNFVTKVKEAIAEFAQNLDDASGVVSADDSIMQQVIEAIAEKWAY